MRFGFLDVGRWMRMEERFGRKSLTAVGALLLFTHR